MTAQTPNPRLRVLSSMMGPRCQIQVQLLCLMVESQPLHMQDPLSPNVGPLSLCHLQERSSSRSQCSWPHTFLASSTATLSRCFSCCASGPVCAHLLCTRCSWPGTILAPLTAARSLSLCASGPVLALQRSQHTVAPTLGLRGVGLTEQATHPRLPAISFIMGPRCLMAQCHMPRYSLMAASWPMAIVRPWLTAASWPVAIARALHGHTPCSLTDRRRLNAV